MLNGFYGRPAVQQADQILVDLKKLKFFTNRTVKIFIAFNEHMLLSYRITNVFLSVFWVRCIVRLVVEALKNGTPCFFMLIPTIKYYRT